MKPSSSGPFSIHVVTTTCTTDRADYNLVQELVAGRTEGARAQSFSALSC